jgi:dephospho-CoA kinase
MVRIAVTGGIACGKSLVGRFLSDEGIPVCEADELAHDQMKPGSRSFLEIVRLFGKGILGREGSIDRQRFGRRVFSKPLELARLNAIVHPHVKRAWSRWLAKRSRDSRVAAVIVPLLYEVGAGKGWDAVICVAAWEDIQIRRLKDRGLSEADARKRMRAQMETDRKTELADFVVMNNGTEEMLREQTRRVMRSILEK